MPASRSVRGLFHQGLLAFSIVIPLVLFAPLIGAQGPAQPPPAPSTAAGPWKNLKVLPKNITKPELKAIMKAQSKALGVDCDYCHKEPNMEAETEKKQVAREMMRLTDDVNKKYRSATDGKVTCWSCHRGEKHPAAPPK